MALPVDKTSPTTGRDLAKMLLGVVLVVVALNTVAFIYFTLNPSNAGVQLVREKWSMVSVVSEPVDWLILGDSSCNQGLDPSVFESELGGTSLNLCTTGDMLVADDAWMLDLYLERVGPPQAVVIGHVYDVWHRDTEALTATMWAVPQLAERVEQLEPAVALDRRDRFLIRFGRYLPLYSRSTTLRTFLMRPTALFAQSSLQLDERGFSSRDEQVQGRVDRDAANHLAFLSRNEFSVDPINDAALRHIVQLGEDFDFDVYLVAAPTFEGVASTDDFREYTSQLDAYLQDLTADTRARVIPRLAGYPAEQLQNVDHLRSEGALHYTSAVIEAIRQ